MVGTMALVTGGHVFAQTNSSGLWDLTGTSGSVGLNTTISLTNGGKAKMTANNLKAQTDPYNNSGTLIRQGLPVEDEALLPDIIYPYLPSGNIIQNWGSKDLRSAPDTAAVEAIIIFMAQSFSGKTSSGQTGALMWRLAVYLTVFGLMLSGFFIFKSVSAGKKGPGEAILALVLKIGMCIMMLLMICPNLPPMMIGLSNYLTDSIDGWFSYTNSKGKTDSSFLEATYTTKMAAGTAAAGTMLASLTQALSEAPGADPDLKAAMESALEQIEQDSEIKAATNQDDTVKNGLATVKALYGMSDARSINVAIAKAAHIPPVVVLDRVRTIVTKELSKTSASITASQPIIEAIAKAPQGMDLTGITYPDRLISTMGYITMAYLALSIWGIGFASLAWVMIYSLPEEWNMGGILFSGIKGGLTILLTVVLVSIYMGASLNWTEVKAEKITTDVPSGLSVMFERAKNVLSANVEAVSSWAGLPWKAADLIKNVLLGASVGDIAGQALSSFFGLTMEQFIIGMLILTAPAQAAMMVKGANGVGESAAKALNANGAAGQGAGGIFGTQAGGTGVTAGSNASAASIMNARGDNRSWMGPSVSPFGKQ